jgi:glycerol 3-phosphatase-2
MPPSAPGNSPKPTMSEPLLSVYDAVLLDLDGTVYHGPRPIPGAADAVREVRAHGTPIRFVTNNAARSPAAVADTLRAIDIPAEDDEVSTSAQAGAKLLAERIPAGSAVVVVGAEALADEVRQAGLRPVREAGDDVAGVIQGHSPDTCWANLAEGCVAIRAGAHWMATNIDVTLPTERGELPGNGALVEALRSATGAEPEVAGKPEPPLLRTAAASVGAHRPLAVGDRLNTDIAGAVAAGMDSLLVLTGVATPAQLLAAIPAERPTYLGADLGALREPAERVAIGPRPGWRIETGDGELGVSGDGGKDPLDLLRALCAAAWDSNVTKVRPEDEPARHALTELGLT